METMITCRLWACAHLWCHTYSSDFRVSDDALQCCCLPLRTFPWWRHQMETFSVLLAICAGESPGNSSHKGQWLWRGALMFSLICAWINGWVNNREAGDLRRHRAHYDVTVISCLCPVLIEWPIDAIWPDGTKPLPEPILTYHQCIPVTII